MGSPLTLGVDVTIGHQVMLHGCTIGDGSLVGIQAVVLNGASDRAANCLVGAGSVVTEGKEFPDNSTDPGQPGQGGAGVDTRTGRERMRHGALGITWTTRSATRG